MNNLSGKASLNNAEVYRNLSFESYIEGILSGNRSILARAITLIESTLEKHQQKAQELLSQLLPYSGNSIRIGITGSPGVGKSTFIENFGLFLCEKGHKVAVLTIDPTSILSKGSILGDKTRMEKLAQHQNAFIRPSPSGGMQGGVSKKTRETILLCESAGFDIIIVETVGVGQSEVLVRSMVDFFLLMIHPGAGDQIQAFKKGIVELADAILVNKADGENIELAKITFREYQQALNYISPATDGWNTEILLASAIRKIGIEETWATIERFKEITIATGVFQLRRREQVLDWMYSMIKERIIDSFLNNPKVKALLPEIESQLFQSKITPTQAVNKIFSVLKYENFGCNE
ncbi:MAG: methylmalonyl Co-A mutase-associated GTPase MeaB [Ignavibacteria bacterium]|nr:methylmalonyl Co-A mutase-associated GTPase MeaB [Ignavibacteria bacterium]